MHQPLLGLGEVLGRALQDHRVSSAKGHPGTGLFAADVAPAHGEHGDRASRNAKIRQGAPDGGALGRNHDSVQLVGVGVLDAARLVSVEHPPQAPVVVVAGGLHQTQDLLRRDTEPLQEMGGQHHACLDRLRHHHGRTCQLELLHVGVVVGAHHDRQTGLQRPAGVDDAGGGLGVVERDDHGSGSGDACGLQDFPVRAVTEEDLLAGLPGLANQRRVEVETHGSGQGIDRPEGVYPDLHMWWQPVYLPSCTFCAERMKEGEPQFCVMDCPTQALAFGDVDDPDSAYSQARVRLEASGARFWELDDAGTTTRSRGTTNSDSTGAG